MTSGTGAGNEPDPGRVPDLLRKRPVPPATTDSVTEPGGAPHDEPDEPQVGEFRQGNPFSRASLAGYLVGRAVAESLGNSLFLMALVPLVIAAVCFWLFHSTALGVLFVVLAVMVIFMRWLLLAVLRRLTGFARFAPLERRVRAMAGDTKSDVLRELRRLGLPGRGYSVWLVPLRLLRRTRRAETLERLRGFDVRNAVPASRVDELHLLLRQAVSGGQR